MKMKCSTKQLRPWYNNQLLEQRKIVGTRGKNIHQIQGTAPMAGIHQRMK